MNLIAQLTGLVRSFLATLCVDPLGLIPNLSHEPLNGNLRQEWIDTPWWRFKQRTPLGRLLSFTASFKSSLWWILKPTPKPAPGEAALLTITTNQFDALSPFAVQLARRGIECRMLINEDVRVAPLDLPEEAPLKIEEGMRSLEGWGRLFSIPFLPLVLLRAFTSRGYQLRSFAWAIDQYWYAYGLYFVCRWWLLSSRPAALVLSNDHSVLPCTLRTAANHEGIPTFYIQHACVTDRFPPLRFKYSLLDGRDALNKYAAAGPTESNIFLIGMCKADKHAHAWNDSTAVRTLGVCLSMVDDLDRSEEMLDSIGNAGLDFEVTVRPHPRSSSATLQRIRSVVDRLGFHYSGLEETAFEFLLRQDAVVGGVSAVTLEAAMINVTPIHFRLNNGTRDWYGFIERGLCPSFDQPEDLVEHLRKIRDNRPDASDVSAYYCETLGTSSHGHSAELAAEVVAAVVRGERPEDAPHWSRLTEPEGVVAYGLAEREERVKSRPTE